MRSVIKQAHFHALAFHAARVEGVTSPLGDGHRNRDVALEFA